MKKLMIIILLLDMLCAKEVEQKMILSTHLEVNKAAKSLYTLEIFFRENSFAKEIKSDYHLSLQMELLEQYVLVTIKPIQTAVLKNKLHYMLQEHYPQNFIVDDTRIRKVIEKEKTEIKKEKVTSPTIISDKKIIQDEQKGNIEQIYTKVNTFWKTIDMAWIGLFILALVGLLLVYRSTRQIAKIKKLQQKVESYQTKIESQLGSIGDKNA